MDTPTPKTQTLWMEHVHFANEEEAEEALADFRDLCTKLESESIALRDALQELRDEQNDAPLETRRTQWQAAMDKADALLANVAGQPTRPQA